MALDLSGGVAESIAGGRVLVWCEGPAGHVAGLELWKRAVYTACRAGFDRLLIVVAGGAEEAMVRRELEGDHRLDGRRWDVAAPDGPWAQSVRETGGRWVLLRDRWIVEAAHLRDLADTTGEPVSASPQGPVAADAADLVELAPVGRAGAARTLPAPPLYYEVRSPADLRRAEDALFQSLARNVTNFFAKWIDRPMSRAISRAIAPYPITPNQITVFSVGMGVVGALCLLSPTYGMGLVGSFLFLLSTIVDGCDGEIARLKFQESAIGAKLDVIGDNVVHAALFPCVAVHAYRSDPTGPYLWLGAFAFAGVVVTWLAIYFVIVRGTPNPRVLAFFEAFGNREFAYLFFLLGLIGKLHWFVWAMPFGLWVFPIGLLVLDRLGPQRGP